MTKTIFTFKQYDNPEDNDTLELEMIRKFCQENDDYDYQFNQNNLPLSTIPIGSVDWCEIVYGPGSPDYYPHFLSDYLYRRIWKSNYQEVMANYQSPIFIKPASKYKKWTGFVYQSQDQDLELGLESSNDLNKIENTDEIWCSEVVEFINEWRYYLVGGKVLASAWYDGKINNSDVLEGLTKPSPELPTTLVNKLKRMKYHGVIDMGEIMLKGNLTLALIEAVEPYAIGWYLDDPDSYYKYAEFIIKSDRYLRSKIL